MILHLVTDEQFTDYAILQFSAPEMESEFVLIPSNFDNWTVKLIDRCTIVKQNSPEFDALLNRLDQYSGIVLHGMFWGKWQTLLLQLVPKHVKVAWMFWGGEIYSRHEIGDRYLAPITKWMSRIHNLKQKNNQDRSWEIPLELYNRVDYCLADMQEEYLLGKQFTGASYNHLWYNYYSIEETVGALKNSRCEGQNIWVGNSAALANNHVDVMCTLWKKGLSSKLENRQVIFPLSYGSIWVRNAVKKLGSIQFGGNMHALDVYIPRDEYNKLMLSCSTMIIDSWLPLAQGNIITALWLGMRVYLSEKNLTYHYFKRIGCKVYSVEKDMNRKNPDVFAPMKQEDIDTNRAVLRQWYSKEEMHKRNLEIVKALS